MRSHSLALLMLAVIGPTVQAQSQLRTRLETRGTQFLINGEPTFLLGISYYGGLAAPPKSLRRLLDEMQRHGFNWLRVWGNWGAFGQDAAVDADGHPRPAGLDRLKDLVGECDRRGLVVDVTLS